MRIARPAAAVSALALALSASAQTPVPGGIHKCGGVKVDHPTWSRSPLEPRSQDLGFLGRRTDLCSEYTHSGWQDTLRLYLGEGAHRHRDVIELAVQKWNEALIGFNEEPIIEITNRRPRNYFLPDDFWSVDWDDDNSNDYSIDLVDDRQSVIYFKGNGGEWGSGGFARWRWNDDQSTAEADMYINVTDWEEYGPHLVELQEVLKVENHRAYVAVDAVYTTVLHEIGHALGMYHVPVSGNVMSYNYMPHLKDAWSVAMVLEVFRNAAIFGNTAQIFESDRSSPIVTSFSSDGPREHLYIYLDDPSPAEDAMINFFTQSAGLGEQDRMGLLCIYEFSRWNH